MLEMDFNPVIIGLIIGFTIAAPVGPIGVLCIRRTLSEGRLSGFISGLGAASADAVYGCVAGLGLTFISGALIEQQAWLRLIGGLFLCYLGARTVLAKPEHSAALPQKNGLCSAYATTFVLTLANPMTILSFAAIFAGLGIAGSVEGYGSAGALVLGVFMGSAIWWSILSAGVGLLRERLDLRGLKWVNWVSGAIIVGFGLAAIAGTAQLI